MEGIIFDFNGTMFQDSKLHEQAWLEMIRRYTPRAISEQEILMNIHGHTNDEILRHFVSQDLDAAEITKLSEEKEQNYRELCLKDPDQLVLTKGLQKVLEHLKEQAIPRTIATATGKENLDFYFDVFDLARWFTYEKVVYDDGTFPGKPQPDIFLKAAKMIELSPENCIVIEDAYSGLLAAQRAGIGKIIAIDPSKKNQEIFREKNMHLEDIIQDFTEFPLSLFGNSVAVEKNQ